MAPAGAKQSTLAATSVDRIREIDAARVDVTMERSVTLAPPSLTQDMADFPSII
jgi:hypothetical protein